MCDNILMLALAMRQLDSELYSDELRDIVEKAEAGVEIGGSAPFVDRPDPANRRAGWGAGLAPALSIEVTGWGPGWPQPCR